MRKGNNIRQRADGRFEARYAKGRDKKGRIIYGCCYGRSWEEAAQKRELILLRDHPAREMNLLILGAGSYGQEVRELAESLRIFRKIAFLDDKKPEAIGPIQNLTRYLNTYPVAVPAIGDQTLRTLWLGNLVTAGFILPVLVHPSAAVSPSAEIGCGTVVCARASVSSGATIGRGCIISSGATIDRKVKIPDGAYIACGQAVVSDVKMNEEEGFLCG